MGGVHILVEAEEEEELAVKTDSGTLAFTRIRGPFACRWEGFEWKSVWKDSYIITLGWGWPIATISLTRRRIVLMAVIVAVLVMVVVLIVLAMLVALVMPVMWVALTGIATIIWAR